MSFDSWVMVEVGLRYLVRFMTNAAIGRRAVLSFRRRNNLGNSGYDGNGLPVDGAGDAGTHSQVRYGRSTSQRGPVRGIVAGLG
ncbi:hypothetical protein SPHINGO391_210010 [Sphingomonas aurantiaca]|uniref:Uncharacterized protein n=1 Tax=Sphingomonas aurantiaca TaxID=185949 RepID=A0A5E7XXF4_9SPHN|nr:hypothetical protein SPHINGO391_210010 [Sphingomonas aurantiaca]